MAPQCGIVGTVEPTRTEACVAALRRTVEAHRPHDSREEAAKARFLLELARLERPFDEDADLVHVTASSVVVGKRGTVLHLHRRLRRWLQPGGHVDPGECPEEAAMRESFEETGLPLSHPPGGPRFINLDVHEAAQGHIHLDVRYLLVADDVEPAPLPGESPAVRWFDWDEAQAIADDGLAGALEVARNIVATDQRILTGSETTDSPETGGPT